MIDCLLIVRFLGEKQGYVLKHSIISVLGVNED